MKKLTVLALAAALAAGSLAACGTYTDASEPAASSQPSSSSAASTAESKEESSEEAPVSEGPTEFTIIATQPNTLNMIQSASNLDSYAFYLT